MTQEITGIWAVVILACLVIFSGVFSVFLYYAFICPILYYQRERKRQQRIGSYLS